MRRSRRSLLGEEICIKHFPHWQQKGSRRWGDSNLHKVQKLRKRKWKGKWENRKNAKRKNEHWATEREGERGDNRTTGVNYAHSGHSRRQEQQQASESCRTARTPVLPGPAWQGVEAGQHELLICITSSKEIYFLVLAKAKLCKWCVQNTIETFSRSTLLSFPCFAERDAR